LGKDPNRYRPSAEALCRRIVKGIELYRINTLVDLINLLSLKTGYSIGGFDADKIRGNLTLGVGKAGEKFEGIGRGLLNIEGLPVYRDEQGGIGTPTSDEERTKIDSDTSHLLMIINAYSGKQGLPEAVDYGVELLKKYAHAQEITVWDSSLNLR
ncbi:MAG: phenylalanine--tRNA ligase beta subunit-related protein, partial [Dysgonamonadaceae bacterium]